MKTTTKHGQHRFTVKEGADGRPFLILEPLDDGLEAFSECQFSLKLRSDTSLAAAQQIEHLMNENVDGLSITIIDQEDKQGS